MTKILIAEDDKFLANAYLLKLKKMEFDIKLAYDGVETLKAIKQEVPDLLILDLVMPNVDGFSVLEMIRKDEDTKNLPVMVVTNLSQEVDYERIKAMGAQDYIVKTDISLDDLILKIKRLTGGV